MTIHRSSLIDTAPRSAFLSDDATRILRFAEDSLAQGFGAALVTLAEIRGGAARLLGAHMAVRSDALHCGYVSGGCTEAAISAEAAEAIADGCDRQLTIGDGSRFFDIALPCGGAITVLIHVLRENGALRQVVGAMSERKQIGLRYDPSAQSLKAVAFTGPTGWANGCFFTAYRPRIRILLCGGAIELQTTARLATAVGYELLSANTSAEQKGLDVGQIDDQTAVALLFHDLDRELPILKAALAASPFYIGCLGSTRTHKRRSDALRDMGYAEDDISRIKAPIGLFGKARDSASLALSVLADVAATSARVR
jgi:xanthine dehydrogenase accessory factor